MKLELRLKKKVNQPWKSLEKQAIQETISYPSSSKQKKDWEKIATAVKKEEESVKPEGEAALNALFKQIYANASEETKRAMNKSYQESGGTTLSTNWNEVGQGKVEVKPPDGMIPKKYNE